MASVGYDNTVRIWDMSQMTVVNVFEDKSVKNERDGQLNALAWSPKDRDILCFGTVSGLLKVVDVKKNKVIGK